MCDSYPLPILWAPPGRHSLDSLSSMNSPVVVFLDLDGNWKRFSADGVEWVSPENYRSQPPDYWCRMPSRVWCG